MADTSLDAYRGPAVVELNKRQRPALTVQRVNQVLDFDRSTGVFTWKTGRRAGLRAGTRRPDGYIKLTIDQRHYLAHRVVFFMVHGKWPKGEIDHLDGCRSNNAPKNLRDVTPTVNQQNRRVASRNSSAGLLGVVNYRKRGVYLARISVNGRVVLIGTFISPQEAHEAYVEAKRRLHAGCTI